MKCQHGRPGSLILAGLSMLAVIGIAGKERTMAVFAMSDKDETHIQVQAGEKFSLEFITSPGTGYAWILDAPIDQNMLAIIGTENEPRKSDLVGASESEIWIIRALHAGRTEIVLKYARPWEKEAPPLKKHVFKIHSRK